MLALAIGFYSVYHTGYVLHVLLENTNRHKIDYFHKKFSYTNVIGLIPSIILLLLGSFSVFSPLNFRLGMLTSSFLFLIFYFAGIMSTLSNDIVTNCFNDYNCNCSKKSYDHEK
jgi:protein-S-isoprenylcysteine O-methyltransferase Ste14